MFRPNSTRCPFHEKIHAILGTQAVSTPAVLLESGGDGSIGVLSQADFHTDGGAGTGML